MQISELTYKLSSAGIDITKYGKGKAKTIEHLLREINEGETTLEEQDGRLVRSVRVLGVDVYHQFADGRQEHLKEEKQIFHDGRERQRTLDWSLGEKLKPDELPNEVAGRRAIQEELGLSKGLTITKPDSNEKIRTQESSSYPGLESIYKFYRFIVTLDDSQYRTEGYIEADEGGKSTYFRWE